MVYITERNTMKYKLKETAKYKYQLTVMIVSVVGLFAIFALQGLGVM